MANKKLIDFTPLTQSQITNNTELVTQRPGGAVPDGEYKFTIGQLKKELVKIATLSASSETSMRIRYVGDAEPTLSKSASGEYLLTIPTGVFITGFVWKESGATFTGGAIKLNIRDTDGESIYTNYTILGSTTGDEVGQLSGVVVRQTEPQAGDVQATFPNIQSISGDFIIVGKPF